MYAVSRRIGAAVIGAIVVAALALTMTGQAHAADQTVKLTSQLFHANGTEYALSADKYTPTGVIYAHAKARNDKPQITQQQWIKHDLGNNYATAGSRTSSVAAPPPVRPASPASSSSSIPASRHKAGPSSASDRQARRALASTARRDDRARDEMPSLEAPRRM
jgi:hypothetical protein